MRALSKGKNRNTSRWFNIIKLTALSSSLLLENLNITPNDVSFDVISKKYAEFSTYKEIKEVFLVNLEIFEFILSKNDEYTIFRWIWQVVIK